MTEYKAIFEPSEGETTNWPSHILQAGSLTEAYDQACMLKPPTGAGILKVLADGQVRRSDPVCL